MTHPFANAHSHLTEVFQRLDVPDDVHARLAPGRTRIAVSPYSRMCW